MTERAPEQILQRIDWQVIRQLDGLFQGDYRGLFYGQGVDFADLREYQPRDDIRNIDWNVTARMNTPYVRQYVEDRDITAWFLLDLSPSMMFGNADRQKDAVLVDFVTTLARILTRSGNRVGALLYGNSVEQTITPRSGRRQVLRITNDLLRREPSRSGNITNLAPLLHAGLGSIRRRSLIFVISDFIGEPGWEKGLSLLNRRHEMIAVRLLDPREIALPDVGVIVLEDSETGEQLIVDTGDKRLRERFNDAAQAREATLTQSFRRAGVDALTLSTDDDLVAAIVRFSELRKRIKGRR